MWVDTDDLNDGLNRRGDVIENDVHYSAVGYCTLGERFARRAIDLVRLPERPNVVLVMADDQGWGDVGYNEHPFVQTPTLDAMAAEGFVYDRFYAAAPVCSPTRASVLTGRSPVRTNVHSWGHYLRPHERTLAETLGEHGYETGIFGKFHVGSAQPDSPCNPTAMGFDEWCIGLNFFDNDPFLSRGGVVEQRQGRGSEILVDDAIDFLRRHADEEAPLFCVVWFPSPHDPHEELPEDPELYAGEDFAGYYREITLLDEQLGRLRAELRSLGIADDTLLWYCSDNGGLVEATSGGRARKGSVYEGGLRVPSVVEWPAGGLHGRTSVPACTSDIYPTVLSLAGIEDEAPHPLDGVDISSYSSGDATTRPRPIGFWHGFAPGQGTWSDRILEAIHDSQQAGNPPPHDPPRITKNALEFPDHDPDRAVGHAAWLDWPWKLHRIDGDRYELYDLAADPLEAVDLASSPDQSERLERMRTALTVWMESVVASVNGEDY
ncbi:MAG: sulfatase family protein [Planctomycetota bacterium]